MAIRRIPIIGAMCVLALAGCASNSQESPPRASSCTPPAGGRCAGPEGVGAALVGDLSAGKDGRTIRGRFQCGGQLEASETPQRITVTYVASQVRAGAMLCALVPLSVHLAAPVGSRTVVDAVTGHRLVIK
jgi:hypothetical protein